MKSLKNGKLRWKNSWRTPHYEASTLPFAVALTHLDWLLESRATCLTNLFYLCTVHVATAHPEKNHRGPSFVDTVL